MDSRKLNGKDLINVGAFIAIYFVIVVACAMLGFIPIFFPLLSVIAPILGGIPCMLFLTKVDCLIGYYNDLEITAMELAMQNYLLEGEVSGNPNQKIVIMLEKMKPSLNDNELGCINKSQIENGKYKRRYQEW